MRHVGHRATGWGSLHYPLPLGMICMAVWVLSGKANPPKLRPVGASGWPDKFVLCPDWPPTNDTLGNRSVMPIWLAWLVTTSPKVAAAVVADLPVLLAIKPCGPLLSLYSPTTTPLLLIA